MNETQCKDISQGTRNYSFILRSHIGHRAFIVHFAEVNRFKYEKVPTPNSFTDINHLKNIHMHLIILKTVMTKKS